MCAELTIESGGFFVPAKTKSSIADALEVEQPPAPRPTYVRSRSREAHVHIISDGKADQRCWIWRTWCCWCFARQNADYSITGKLEKHFAPAARNVSRTPNLQTVMMKPPGHHHQARHLAFRMWDRWQLDISWLRWDSLPVRI